MEALTTDKDMSIKNEERNENGTDLLIGLASLNEHEGEVAYDKKEDAEISMHMNEQDKLDVPSLVEICKQQLIVILKDMCADSNSSDEKASFMYHLNRLRSAVTVVDLHNYIAVFGPCLSYNKLPSTWNISVCDYLKQQLNILRAADSQQSSSNYVSYLELHNDYEDIIHDKKGNATTTASNSMQGNMNSNNLNSQLSMKGSSIHMNSANSTSNVSGNATGNASGHISINAEGGNLGCFTLGDHEDSNIVEDYYDCLMRTNLSDDSPNCLKYMMNSKNDSLSNTEVENVISYLKKYEVKANKNYCSLEEELKYSKDSDFEYQEDYLKDKTLYDSDLDDNNLFDSNLISSSRNMNDSGSSMMNMNLSIPNSGSANNNNSNNLSGKNYNMKYDSMKKNNSDVMNTWTRACTEGHPEYLPRIPGVRFNPKKQQWLAAWNDNTREIRRYFSVKQYGFEQARILAVKARQEAEKAGARCKPMFHVHGRKTVDSAANEAMKNNNDMGMEDGTMGNNNMGGNGVGGSMGMMSGSGNNASHAGTNAAMNSGGMSTGGTHEHMNKKDHLKNENNKGIKRGRGRPPKRKLSEDSQLSLDDMEQTLCRNGENADLMEAIDSFDKNCTRPMKGVSYNDRKGSWLAYWSIGKNFQMRRFPIKKLGFEKAKELAIQCRLEAEQAGATTTENRTKRIRNLLTMNSENTMDVMMDMNSLDPEDNLNDTNKNMNGNMIMSQMHHHYNAHGINNNNNMHPNKMPHSDCQESENDYSPTKRTRAPRGRRMESLTARASALTPVEGVRFDPYSYSWFAKYLENENSKEPKISKYLLKKWGFNKAHSLAVHTVKCAYKAVPFTDEELINIFNVDSKNLMNNQNSLMNLAFKDTYGNNAGANGNAYNANNYGAMGVSSSANGALMGNMGYMNGAMGGAVGMDHVVGGMPIGGVSGVSGGNFAQSMGAYKGGVNAHGIMNSMGNSGGEKNADMGNMNDEETTIGNGSSNNANNMLSGMDGANGMLNSVEGANNMNAASKMGIMNGCAYNYSGGSSAVNDSAGGAVAGAGAATVGAAGQNNFHHGGLLPNSGIVVGAGLGENNVNGPSSMKGNATIANGVNVYMNEQMGLGANYSGKSFPSGEVLVAPGTSSAMMDDENPKVLNKAHLMESSNGAGNNAGGSVLQNSSVDNYLVVSECVLNNNNRKVGGAHVGNKTIGGAAAAAAAFGHHHMEDPAVVGVVRLNEMHMNAENDINANQSNTQYGIASTGSNMNMNAEPVMSKAMVNSASGSVNLGTNKDSTGSIMEGRDVLDNSRGAEHPLEQRKFVNIMNESGNIDSGVSGVSGDSGANSSYANNNPYGPNAGANFNSYDGENAGAANMIGSNANELNESSMYYMSVKPEIKTEQ
ncbi:asparagine-rich antigen [Plasmodium vivax Brazil I]|uniref:Asparagine-rich antigen n=1 Tax=Plasmodium vivax (strain Brazil I) TaxID=1033975 RepID=A0A0J9SVS3_PLAV1|nr:asparagine-rich antigen [Plasmodium vivax Brazil I]